MLAIPVKVNVKFPLGVHVKSLLAVRAKLPSLSEVTVPAALVVTE